MNKDFEIVSCSDLRLLELGFVPGSTLTVLKYEWYGVVVSLRNSTIALRKTDFHKLTLKGI